METKTFTGWITFRVTPELRHEIEREAVDQDRSVAWIVRQAVKEYLRGHQTDQDTKAA